MSPNVSNDSDYPLARAEQLLKIIQSHHLIDAF